MYFADPYCAWQKGTNENLNGLLREFYPKGRNLSRVSPATLKNNLALINARPKKVLHYHTPQDLFLENLSNCCTWFDNSSPVLAAVPFEISLDKFGRGGIVLHYRSSYHFLSGFFVTYAIPDLCDYNICAYFCQYARRKNDKSTRPYLPGARL